MVGTTKGDFVAVEAATGRIVWMYSAGRAHQRRFVLEQGSRSVSEDLAGNIHWLDISSGKLAWKNAMLWLGGPCGGRRPVSGGVRRFNGGTTDGNLVWRGSGDWNLGGGVRL